MKIPNDRSIKPKYKFYQSFMTHKFLYLEDLNFPGKGKCNVTTILQLTKRKPDLKTLDHDEIEKQSKNRMIRHIILYYECNFFLGNMKQFQKHFD